MSTNHTRTSFSSDDSGNIKQEPDNLHRDEQENSANGLDSTEVADGQDGRNIRALGSQDMDSANGLLRLNDTEDGAMDVPEAAIANAAASEGQTKTGLVAMASPAPAPNPVNVPNAQQAAKKHDQPDDEEPNTSNSDSNTDEAVTQEEKEEAIAETGTSIDHQPAY